MNKWNDLLVGLKNGLYKMKKYYFIYIILIACLYIFPNLFKNINNTRSVLVGTIISLLIDILSLLGKITVTTLYFKMYIKINEINLKIERINKISFSILKIYSSQLVYIGLPIAILYIANMIFSKIIGYDIIESLKYVSILNLLIIYFWLFRLLLVGFLLIFKREKFSKKEILIENMSIIQNYKIIIYPVYLINVVLLFISVFIALIYQNYIVSEKLSIFIMIFSIMSYIIYTQIITDYLNKSSYSNVQLTTAST
jgi:hypothetical protein